MLNGTGPDIDPTTVTPAGNEPIRPAALDKEVEPQGLDALIDRALEADDTSSAGGDRSQPYRDPATQRFAKRPDGATEQDQTSAAPDDGTPAADEKPATESKPRDAISDGHFRGWSKEDREAFGKLPQEAQQFVLARQAAQQSHVTRVEQESAEYQRITEPFLDVYRRNTSYLERVSGDLRSSPTAIVENLLRTEEALRYGTYSDKVRILTQMAADYGVPLGNPQADPLGDPFAPGGEAYPVVHDLRQQLGRVQGELQQLRQREERGAEQTLQQRLVDFESAKGPDGQVLHPNARMMFPAMGQLLRDGKAASLEEAYQQARKPFDDMVAQKLADSQRAAVEKARRAAPVRTSGVAPGGTTKAANLDDLLNQTLAKAGY